MIIFIGVSLDSISTYLSFEYPISIFEWTEIFYLLAYPYVGCIAVIVQTKEQIRSFISTGIMNISIGIYLQIIFPFIAIPRKFNPTTILGKILLYERNFDGPTAAFSSFHVSLAFISAYYYTWRFTKYKFMFYILSIFISISCITTGMHSIIDVIGGFSLFIIYIKREIIWIYLKNYFQYLANSRSSYNIGPLRIINHSLYAFLSGFIRFLIVCTFIGNISAIFLVSISSLIGSVICAKIIEKSSGLSRLFDYFGCITGGFIGSIILSWIFTIPIISILSAYTLTSP